MWVMGQALLEHLTESGIPEPRARLVVQEITGNVWKGKPVNVMEAIALLQVEDQNANEDARRAAESIRAQHDVAEVIQ